jgi:hypothetical protein
MAVIQFHPKHGVGQGLRHRPGHFYDVFFWHSVWSTPTAYGADSILAGPVA